MFELAFTSATLKNAKPKQVKMVKKMIENYSEIGPRIKYPDQAPGILIHDDHSMLSELTMSMAVVNAI